jgi:dinuclear metal center YbgI/SA1388 family protein
MAKLKEVVNFLDNYLGTEDINDDSWNGLQIEGKEDVKKILFAVDSSVETFNRAIQEGADMSVVHHGLFWKKGNPSINGWLKDRVDILYKNGISLYASHLPLDRHEEVGNNAQILKLLNAKIDEGFIFKDGKNIGWIGEAKKPIPIQKIESILNVALNIKSIVLPFGKGEIRTIAVCSGTGGYPGFYEALAKKVDLYLTGDAIDLYSSAKDAKMNIIFAGHHSTEVFGVKALADVVKKKCKVETVFVDIPTGL